MDETEEFGFRRAFYIKGWVKGFQAPVIRQFYIIVFSSLALKALRIVGTLNIEPPPDPPFLLSPVCQ